MPVRVDRAQEVERALSNVYLRLFAEIKKDKHWPNDVRYIHGFYNKKVYDATRKAVTVVYEEGINYVGKKLSRESFPTLTDVTNIEQETMLAVDAFWKRIRADAQRTIDREEGKDVQPFDTKTWLTIAATMTVTATLARATLSKIRQIQTKKATLVGGAVLLLGAAREKVQIVTTTEGKHSVGNVEELTTPLNDKQIADMKTAMRMDTEEHIQTNTNENIFYKPSPRTAWEEAQLAEGKRFGHLFEQTPPETAQKQLAAIHANSDFEKAVLRMGLKADALPVTFDPIEGLDYDPTHQSIDDVLTQRYQYLVTKNQWDAIPYANISDKERAALKITIATRESQVKAAAGETMKEIKNDITSGNLHLKEDGTIANKSLGDISTKEAVFSGEIGYGYGGIRGITAGPEEENSVIKEATVGKSRIRWIAQLDEKTCITLPNGQPGCRSLDGQEWEYDDIDIPVPGRLGPNGTHPNCRCYLELF